MACYEPMPNDLMTILVMNMGLDLRQTMAEYTEPGGPERLRQLAGNYVQSIANANRGTSHSHYGAEVMCDAKT